MDGPRVLVADDHIPTRAGIRSALEEAGYVVCAEAGSAPAAVEAATRTDPDACVIDLTMPGDGLQAVTEIVRLRPATPVLVLTVSNHPDDLLAAVRAGARGYLLKDSDPSELADAVRAAIAGEGVLSGAMTRRLLEDVRRRGASRAILTDDGRAVSLPPREQEVFTLLAEDLSTADIARRLGCSPITVRRHISMLLRRLGVASRAEARRLARTT